MRLEEYQKIAHRTEAEVRTAGSDVIVPILGLAGETGELLNEYKKKLRDGDAHEHFTDRVAEELGDILWYVAATATKFGLDLEDIAERNIRKTQARWGRRDQDTLLPAWAFDAMCEESERFPRQFVADFQPFVENGANKMGVFIDAIQMGDPLTDNAHEADGYRFHDIFHLACTAVLGWSPVVRKLLGKKRRGQPKLDEVEDGGRAIAIEEGVSALVFAYAKDRKRFEGIACVDYDLLKAIRIMTSSLEVSVCTTGEWERAILSAYTVWRQLEINQGGKVALDLDKAAITYIGL
jgi:NTP pyrophosphatase (non-canonical NTP hydrolase)